MKMFETRDGSPSAAIESGSNFSDTNKKAGSMAGLWVTRNLVES
jgi:hypothetical protein